jgi:outer membrane protein TolC
MLKQMNKMVEYKLMKIGIALLVSVSIFFTKPVLAQQTNHLRLEDCYTLAEKNYPLVKQRELISKSKEYSIANISKGYLPQININAQATYQSDVSHLPANIDIPGFPTSSLTSIIPIMSKEQYKLYSEISQPVTGLISTKQEKQLQEVKSNIQQENLEVELYKLKDRINQLFFGVLLADEQYNQNELLKKDIQTGITKVNVNIENGADFRSNIEKLKAELLKSDQHSIELKSTKKAYIDMLELFINQSINDSTVFEKPAIPPVSQSIKRPELIVFDSQNKSYSIQNKLLTTKNIPKLEFFFQGGLGKPSPVNAYFTGLSSYYLGGIRLSWPLSGLYTVKKDRQLLEIDKNLNDAQKETFLFNTNFTLKQQNTEVSKLQELIKSDDEIVELRSSVKIAANVQLENGAISVNDFLKEINSEDQARQDRLLHEIQLLNAFYNYQNTSGN